MYEASGEYPERIPPAVGDMSPGQISEFLRLEFQVFGAPEASGRTFSTEEVLRELSQEDQDDN